MKATTFDKNPRAPPKNTIRCMCGELLAQGKSYKDHIMFCPEVIKEAKVRHCCVSDFCTAKGKEVIAI